MYWRVIVFLFVLIVFIGDNEGARATICFHWLIIGPRQGRASAKTLFFSPKPPVNRNFSGARLVQVPI